MGSGFLQANIKDTGIRGGGPLIKRISFVMIFYIIIPNIQGRTEF